MKRADQPHCCISEDMVGSARRTMGRLKSAELTVATAESCTAGLIATALSFAEGAGDLLHGSFVTYTKQQKTDVLGVSTRLLKQKGAVNREVAKQMATGTLKHSPADLVVAVTGVLGPAPDEDGAPVGLIYFAVQRRGRKVKLRRKFFPRTEHNIMRRKVVKIALQLLAKEAR